MKHKNKVRNYLTMHAREQARRALCALMAAALAGLFSSCAERNMGGSSPQIQNEHPFKSPAGSETALSHLEEGKLNVSIDFERMLVPLSAPENVGGSDSGLSGTASAKSQTASAPSPAVTTAPTPKTTPPPSKAPVSTAIVNPYTRYTWDQMMAEAEKLQERYPEFISLSSAGKSVEGRDLLLVKLGTGERKILLCGAHHAREYISSSYLMKMIETYADYARKGAKFGNYNVKALLDKVTIYIVPMVNPDGVNLVNKGLKAASDPEAVDAMKMVESSYREWKANINGVDLNRQYPACWDEKYDNVGVPASENYKGTKSATEPEVQAMMKLSEDNDFILSASFHSKGNLVYWADSGTVKLIPGVKDIAKRLGLLTGFELMPVSQKPSIYGAGYENWFRLEFKRPSFCIELTSSDKTNIPHDDKDFDSLVWKKAKYIGLFLANEALKR